jgi:dihydrolipoamide dehydrogenase
VSGSIEKSRLAVIGAGPGGYAAAFRAADLGLDVTLIDPEENPGGVCLYRGCIPSKALLHVARVLGEAKHAEALGVTFGVPQIDVARVRAWKDEVVQNLVGGLGTLCKARKIRFVRGRASFVDSNSLVVDRTEAERLQVGFDYAVIATGSRPVVPDEFFLDSPRVMGSTAALELESVPKSLLVVGGGYIGLELGTVYAALGTKVSVVEMTDRLLAGVDADLVRPLVRAIEPKFESIWFDNCVESLSEVDGGVSVVMRDSAGSDTVAEFEKVLCAVGRRPNSSGLGLQRTAVTVDDRGFIEVDESRRTTDPAIFAIGDVAGDPMLAHKATHEGLVAAEAVAGRLEVFDPAAIPAVVFTDPEIAWCGLTEADAIASGREVGVARFPWQASGRAQTLGGAEGLTKLIFEPDTERLLGAGIVGPGAGDLISEAVLAIEMGAVAEDLARTVHPHPTLSETVMEAADVFRGLGVHLKKRRT